MKAIDFLEHCMSVARWVNWEQTVDRFMHGNPRANVKGIAVTWIATNVVLEKAAKLGLNFVISHEDVFYQDFADRRSEAQHHERKRKLIEKLGITLIRCHDTWDRIPDVGIVDAWADFLNFPVRPRNVESYYKICNVSGYTAQDIAKKVLAKIKPLGQKTINIMGNLQKEVRRLAVGTGAITSLPKMHELGADIILATDDGLETTSCGLWSLDLDIPVLIVNHATAELPGVMAMVPYIKKHFPNVIVKYIPCDFPAQTLL